MHAREVRAAVTALGRGWLSFDELVRTSTLPRRTVEELLDDLGDDVERDGGLLRLRPDTVTAHHERVGTAAAVPPGLREEIGGHLDAVPPPLPALDHVQATPDTVLHRARWLDEQYDLRHARLLFLGDHDLTSLAVHALRGEADVTVVDVDDRVLEHIDTRSGGAVRTVHADLRYGLPLAVTGTADVVFSDPPYTPEGMTLFASRAIECLADRAGRVVLAYGYSHRHPTLGHQVQRALSGLGLTFEAILPGFHRYAGAQAIGSAADLYVCQPTARARKKKRGAGQAIYTHGPRSVEATRTPEQVRAGLLSIAGEDGSPVEERGPDWTAPASVPEGTAVAVDLSGDPGPWLVRVLLAVNAGRVALLVPNAHPDLADAAGQRALTELLAPKYRLRLLRSTPDNTHAVVLAEAPDAADTSTADTGDADTGTRTVREVWTRAHGRLGNLLPHAPADIADLRLVDVPRHKIVRLLWASGPGG
ncbi:bis-aminopropyl spermidine synthase family protein [Saccharomonospora iraqiensis]|uniref:bis-aminopropyl spermidine synthase family protein n=1 Tax=Saccharomonospora iraqiensis TaxID=52698 RepID=UPI0003F94F6C|nr:bis-aminopropyl spermidine synthase family protein [Saccharomonospora iraqiensis]